MCVHTELTALATCSLHCADFQIKNKWVYAKMIFFHFTRVNSVHFCCLCYVNTWIIEHNAKTWCETLILLLTRGQNAFLFFRIIQVIIKFYSWSCCTYKIKQIRTINFLLSRPKYWFLFNCTLYVLHSITNSSIFLIHKTYFWDELL